MVEGAALLRPREHIARALTKELLIRRTMNADQVDTIIMQADAAKALADEHARRAAWRRTLENGATRAPSLSAIFSRFWKIDCAWPEGQII
jgi:hypothetical protein